jgi:hypothetical protein
MRILLHRGTAVHVRLVSQTCRKLSAVINIMPFVRVIRDSDPHFRHKRLVKHAADAPIRSGSSCHTTIVPERRSGHLQCDTTDMHLDSGVNHQPLTFVG